MKNATMNNEPSAADLLPAMVNIDASGNHVFFYDDVDETTILRLNKTLRDMITTLINLSQNALNEPCIYLHINSGGGSIFDAFSAVDTIISSPVPIITIVEGCAASAATLISLAGSQRLIHRHGCMLIHQLSSAFWGKHNEFEDNMQNLNSLMKMIKDFYVDHSNIPAKNLDEMLKHDLYLNAAQSAVFGLVDQIIGGEDDVLQELANLKKNAPKAKKQVSKSRKQVKKPVRKVVKKSPAKPKRKTATVKSSRSNNNTADASKE